MGGGLSHPPARLNGVISEYRVHTFWQINTLTNIADNVFMSPGKFHRLNKTLHEFRTCWRVSLLLPWRGGSARRQTLHRSDVVFPHCLRFACVWDRSSWGTQCPLLHVVHVGFPQHITFLFCRKQEKVSLFYQGFNMG